METIKNEWEGSKEVVPYEPPDLEEEVGVEFLALDTLEDVEMGIQKATRAADLLSLIRGLGIVKIEREALWQQAGFSSLRAYRIVQSHRLNLPSATIAQSRRIAEAWIDHRKILEGIQLRGNVAKLRHFNQAVRIHGDKRLVLKHFKEDSIREFARFSKPDRKPDIEEVSAVVKAGTLYIEDSPVAKLDPSLPDHERDFLMVLLRKAYSARRGNLLPHVVAVYDQGEARAVDNFIKKFRASK